MQGVNTGEGGAGTKQKRGKLLMRSQVPPDVDADAIDAFARPWSERSLYVNPPWYRIPDVLRRIIRDGACILTILPV